MLDLLGTLLLTALGYSLHQTAYAEGYADGYKAGQADALGDPGDGPIVMEHTHGGEEEP